MAGQQQLPGTEAVVGTYSCGHGRTHQIPSESVRLFKMGGAGFVAGCDCGAEPLDQVADLPHRLGPHVTLVGGKGLGPGLWLALEQVTDGWWGDDEGQTTPVGGGRSRAERRADRRQEFREEVTDGR